MKVTSASTQIDIYLDDKNISPCDCSDQGALSKSFTGTTTLQDFLVRGRSVYLHVRRRKWQLRSRKVTSNKQGHERCRRII
ncbi:ISAon1 family transposase N-terminal region protein [Butyricimonas faecihominis]|uniref:ISAon1 family transposase N-terminal region protein n=1 Tax=Butyricimonas faecihominis TaxID=1472416 RepID=UPI003D7480E9